MNTSTPTSVELSFEYFPPRSEHGMADLLDCHAKLAVYQPNFVSITCGAGGSTQQGTFDAVEAVLATGAKVAPHVTCIGSSRDQVEATIKHYQNLGIERLVLLRGDLPKQQGKHSHFAYASELVSYVDKHFADSFHIEVAAYPDCHPESKSPDSELRRFKQKVDAGANSAITQYFYNADSYFAFLDDAQRLDIDIPITPGIMPITNFSTLVRFSDACGAEIPRWIRARLEQFQGDPDSLKSFGFDVVANLCLDLLDNGVHGLHFYTLNKSQTVAKLCSGLGFNKTV